MSQGLLRGGGVRGLPSQLLRRRDTWQSLAPFAVEQRQQEAWQRLRERAHAVQTTVERMQQVAEQKLRQKKEEKGIDWKDWENRIYHKGLLDCLKKFHTAQWQLLEDAAAGKETQQRQVTQETEKLQQQGWRVYADAVAACKKSVARSEELLSNGARALWISHRNPPVTRVDTNEWLDSDQYWQAFVEKHHFYSQYQPGVADPEAPEQREAFKKTWHTRMEKFNERSDTPMLYEYMDQLPSWEYYDLHRGAFLEHMMYYLIRTGGDFRFFPQLPPWQWVAHIEQLRYNFLSVAQRRRAQLQLQHLERERALDLLPLDIAHDGEAAIQQQLQQEKRLYELLVARLMNNYMFCCGPLIPAQSVEALQDVVLIDGAKGKLYSLGEDVHAIFYLPQRQSHHHQQQQDARPLHAFQKLLTHMHMTGRRFNPSYNELLRIHMEILEQRGEHWLTAPGECVSQAFLRRLRTDDPAYGVYMDYFKELYSRAAAAEQISAAEAVQRLQRMQKAILHEERLFSLLLQQQSSSTSTSTTSPTTHSSTSGSSISEVDVEAMKTSPGSPDIQAAMRQGKLKVFNKDSTSVTPSRQTVTNARTIQQSFAEFQQQQQQQQQCKKEAFSCSSKRQRKVFSYLFFSPMSM